MKKVFYSLMIIAALAVSFVAGQQSVSIASTSDEISVASIIRGA